MIKILLADDHELVRTGIQALLNACDDMSVVGVASSGEEVVEKVSNLLIDVVLMGIDMPGMGGAEACRQILQANAEAKIIVVSVSNDSHIPPELFKLGVSGFISKDSPVDEIRSYALTAGEKSGFKYSFPQLNSEINAAMTFLNNSCRIW